MTIFNSKIRLCYDERRVTAWLNWLIDSGEGRGVSRHVRRLIHKSEKRLGVSEEVKVRIDDLMEEIERLQLYRDDIPF
jgi:hypothetical protein